MPTVKKTDRRRHRLLEWIDEAARLTQWKSHVADPCSEDGTWPRLTYWHFTTPLQTVWSGDARTQADIWTAAACCVLYWFQRLPPAVFNRVVISISTGTRRHQSVPVHVTIARSTPFPTLPQRKERAEGGDRRRERRPLQGNIDRRRFGRHLA